MEDGKIIELFWQRSQRAIEETRKKYEVLCKRISFQILHNAEECVSDSYMALWNTIPEERPRYFKAYVCKITRNLSMNRLDYLLAKKRSIDDTVSLEELGETFPEGDDMLERLTAQELEQAIHDFLRTLPKKKRLIFVRRYFFMDNIADIGKLLGMNQNTVKSILSRDGKKLRAYLEARGYGQEGKVKRNENTGN